MNKKYFFIYFLSLFFIMSCQGNQKPDELRPGGGGNNVSSKNSELELINEENFKRDSLAAERLTNYYRQLPAVANNIISEIQDLSGFEPRWEEKTQSVVYISFKKELRNPYLVFIVYYPKNSSQADKSGKYFLRVYFERNVQTRPSINSQNINNIRPNGTSIIIITANTFPLKEFEIYEELPIDISNSDFVKRKKFIKSLSLLSQLSLQWYSTTNSDENEIYFTSYFSNRFAYPLTENDRQYFDDLSRAFEKLMNS